MRFQFSKACHYAIVIALGFHLAADLRALDGAGSEQQSAAALRRVRYTAKALDAQGKPVPGAVEIRFALYRDRADHVPLWHETQQVRVDADGKYSVQLGAATPEGLPVELFSSGAAHWLGVQINRLAESPRIQLSSVAYALLATDAQTLGGLPPSAFRRVVPGDYAGLSSAPANSQSQPTAQSLSSAASIAVTTPGTTSHLPSAPKLARFNASSQISFSQIVDNGTSVGIGTQTPAAKLDVNGTGMIRGGLSIPSTTQATAAVGVSSPTLTQTASSFYNSIGFSQSNNAIFGWKVIPRGNNTTAPSATLNQLYGTFSTPPTGLSISNKGLVAFSPGQGIPGKVALKAPSDFVVTGSPIGSGTIGLDWAVPPSSSGGDFPVTPNSIVTRDINGQTGANVITSTTVETTGPIAVGPLAIPNTFVVGINQLVGPNTTFGVVGTLDGPFDGSPIEGVAVAGTGQGGAAGVRGISYGNTTYGGGQGVWGESMGTWNSRWNGFGPDGVDGLSHSSSGSGVVAINLGGGSGFYAQGISPGYAGNFSGNVYVTGSVSKSGGSFKIDDPLDPADKYLSHSFVESPDMMNIYNGNLTTNVEGEAVVELPEWFESLNRDFRYNLTVMGQFAHAIVTQKVANYRFTIKTDKPRVEVSWQVTGIRHDEWADAHRIPVEEAKPSEERGRYLHPELFGKNVEESLDATRHPAAVRMLRSDAAAQSQFAK